MKNFIEMEISNEKMLINVNHIVRIKEINDKHRQGCEIHLTSNDSIYSTTSRVITDKITEREATKMKKRLFFSITYEALKEKIEHATA